MKIGYPCINRTIECQGNKTFRLKSYSEKKLVRTIDNNLDCLLKILQFNVKHNILFFRITSDLVPFASHPICKFNWQKNFRKKFQVIGDYIKYNNIRISMHPDQFIVINSINDNVVFRSISELNYHSEVLDLMELDNSSKIQLHIGGIYNDKKESKKRFTKNYNILSKSLKSRLVIENDHISYDLKDCMDISKEIDIPILFDVFHHSIKNNKESISKSFEFITKTWKTKDGIPMIDYSSQQPGKKKGVHAEKINKDDFTSFLKNTHKYDFDVMFEIKDKEKSVLKVMKIVKSDPRFIKN